MEQYSLGHVVMMPIKDKFPLCVKKQAFLVFLRIFSCHISCKGFLLSFIYCSSFTQVFLVCENMWHVFSCSLCWTFEHAQLLRIFFQRGDNTNNIVTVTVASMHPIGRVTPEIQISKCHSCVCTGLLIKMIYLSLVCLYILIFLNLSYPVWTQIKDYHGPLNLVAHFLKWNQ